MDVAPDCGTGPDCGIRRSSESSKAHVGRGQTHERQPPHAYGDCLSRLFQAVLTEKGEEAATAIRLASIERLEKPLSSLSPAERDELVDLATRAVSLLLKIRLG